MEGSAPLLQHSLASSSNTQDSTNTIIVCAVSRADQDITPVIGWCGVGARVLMLYCASLLQAVHDVGSLRFSAYSRITGEDSRWIRAKHTTDVLICDNKTTRIFILRGNLRVLHPSRFSIKTATTSNETQYMHAISYLIQQYTPETGTTQRMNATDASSCDILSCRFPSDPVHENTKSCISMCIHAMFLYNTHTSIRNTIKLTRSIETRLIAVIVCAGKAVFSLIIFGIGTFIVCSCYYTASSIDISCDRPRKCQFCVENQPSLVCGTFCDVVCLFCLSPYVRRSVVSILTVCFAFCFVLGHFDELAVGVSLFDFCGRSANFPVLKVSTGFFCATSPTNTHILHFCG